MNLRFPYLKNQKSLEEIRKHKWIESEKNGKEVGFPTAALEWIRKYGPQWHTYHVKKRKKAKIS